MQTRCVAWAAVCSVLLASMGACSGSSDDGGGGDATEAGVGADASQDAAPGSDAASMGDTSSGSDAGAWVDAGDASDAGAQCVVDGGAYASGAVNPASDCQSCQPAISSSTWTALSDGTSCGDAGICHAGACASGCELASAFVADGTLNPLNACQSCEPSTSTTTWTGLGDGTSCGNGQICVAAMCGSECDIGGTVVASTVENLSNVCQSCQPGTSTSAWTTTNGPNAGCPAGDVCNGSCQLGCWIDGAFVADGTTAKNGCEVCQAATSTTSWTLVTGVASCGAGQVCNAGSCAPGCSIANVYVATNATANSGCEVCAPGTSRTSWTNVSGVGSCGAGEACNAGSCSSGCSIAGTFYGSGATAQNGCESCAPASSNATWTNATDGQSCTASQVCVAGGCGTLTAVTVPFAPLNPSLPHPVLNGTTTTVKGVALNGATQFMWDFGDGSAQTAWTTITDPNNLGVAHTYTASVGQRYFAKLTVRTSPVAVSLPAVYPVQIADPAASFDPHLDIAVDRALWYLHTTATRGTYAAGAPGYGQPYESSSDIGSVCASVEAYERRGSGIHVPITTDPYSEDVRRLTNFVFAGMSASAIGSNAHGNPDGNGNGFGLTASAGTSETSAWAACGQAIGRIGDASYVVPTGITNVHGRALGDVAQDLADWIVFNQYTGTGLQEGGWGFTTTPGTSFQYETGWALVGLSGYASYGATIPSYVKTELAKWISADRNTATTAPSCGGWGEELGFPFQADNLATAVGIFGELYAGVPVSNAAIGNLYRNWDTASDNCHSPAGSEPYMIATALRAAGLSRVTESGCDGTFTANSFPWYAVEPANAHSAIATNLLAQQNADGHWADTGSGGDCAFPAPAQATGWSATTLLNGQAGIRAGICNCNVPAYGVNQPMFFDGSCTQLLDASDTSLTYAWDFNYDGTTFVQSVDSSNLPVAGVAVTKVDGFGSYSEDASGNPTGVTHRVALRVADARGGQSIATCNAITKPPPYCPIPSPGGGATRTYHGFIGVPVQLDATGTLNPGGDPLTYAWDFSNLNVFGDSTLTKPTFTWNVNGTYGIEVRVTSHPSAAPACSETAYATVVIGQ